MAVATRPPAMLCSSLGQDSSAVPTMKGSFRCCKGRLGVISSFSSEQQQSPGERRARNWALSLTRCAHWAELTRKLERAACEAVGMESTRVRYDVLRRSSCVVRSGLPGPVARYPIGPRSTATLRDPSGKLQASDPAQHPCSCPVWHVWQSRLHRPQSSKLPSTGLFIVPLTTWTTTSICTFPTVTSATLKGPSPRRHEKLPTPPAAPCLALLWCNHSSVSDSSTMHESPFSSSLHELDAKKKPITRRARLSIRGLADFRQHLTLSECLATAAAEPPIVW